MTITELRQSTSSTLQPEDFLVLLSHVTGKNATFVLSHPEYELSEAEASEAGAAFLRRERHEPVAYITGHKEFYGLEFMVTEATLIPRPETEQMVELALKRISNLESGISDHVSKTVSVVDIGTGSGNIIISLTKTLSSKFKIQDSRFDFFAIDLSAAALAVAKRNAANHSVAEHITFLEGDLFAPYFETASPTDALIILANLPYVSRELYEQTAPDVRLHEPRSALVSAEGGLAHYRKLLESIRAHQARLPQAVTLFLEQSPEQKPALARLVREFFPPVSPVFHLDLAGRTRFCEIDISFD